MAEVRVLQKKLDKLARSLSPVVVATALLAEEVIEQRTWEEARKEGRPQYDRTLDLMEVVLRAVQARPSVFSQFCTILEHETVTAGIAEELRGSLEPIKDRSASPTSEDVKKKDCDDIENCDVLNSKHDPQSILPRKRPAPREEDDGHDVKLKEGKVAEKDEHTRTQCVKLKEGRVTGDDKFFMDLGWEVGGKWEEVGVSLGMEYKVLQSVVGCQVGKPDHMKAFYMFLEWKKRCTFKATYTTLAKALEESGLNSCAEKYCHTLM